MAKKSLIEKVKKVSKYSSRSYNRCPLCGRPRAFMRRFGMCRLCFRSYARKGEIAGLTKSSW